MNKTISAWRRVENEIPQEGEYVLHLYEGVRGPDYGIFRNGRFWIKDGPESVPANYWMRITPFNPHQLHKN
jgi:hypothetical protein